MNKIISVKNENGELLVSARELYKGLEIKTQYTKWINRMFEYGFEENIDYISISQKRLTVQGNETTYFDHILKIDCAKEIAMIQRNDKGKEVRKYFIECEKELKQPQVPQSYAQALLEAGRLALQNEQLQLENKQKQEVIEVITKDNITFDEFNKKVRSLVNIISKSKSITYSEVWRILYSYIDLKIGINLKLRQSNKMSKLQKERKDNNKKVYTNSTLKQKVSVLSTVKECEYDEIFRIINCYCNDHGIDIVNHNVLTIESSIA